MTEAERTRETGCQEEDHCHLLHSGHTLRHKHPSHLYQTTTYKAVNESLLTISVGRLLASAGLLEMTRVKMSNK